MSDERRKYTRYILQKDGFRVFSHECNIVGKLKNISKGGLAYKYASQEKLEKKSKMIDILANSSDKSYVSRIACKTIYDILVLSEDNTFTGTDSRVRGLQVVRLTERKKDQLDFLLAQYATEPLNNLRIP